MISWTGSEGMIPRMIMLGSVELARHHLTATCARDGDHDVEQDESHAPDILLSHSFIDVLRPDVWRLAIGRARRGALCR